MANAVRSIVSLGLVAAVGTLLATWLASEARAQSDKPSLAGAWTLNKDLSDQPIDRGDRDASDRGQRGGGNFGGRRGGGNFGGRRHGGYGGGQTADPEAQARLRAAMRDITNPPDHLAVAETDSTIIITGPDGRTTRLSADGKKIKDDNTGIERKTKWDAGRLVSEISGPAGMKATETYALNTELHQLRLTTQIQGARGGQARTITHVYDADQR